MSTTSSTPQQNIIFLTKASLARPSTAAPFPSSPSSPSSPSLPTTVVNSPSASCVETAPSAGSAFCSPDFAASPCTCFRTKLSPSTTIISLTSSSALSSSKLVCGINGCLVRSSARSSGFPLPSASSPSTPSRHSSCSSSASPASPAPPLSSSTACCPAAVADPASSSSPTAASSQGEVAPPTIATCFVALPEPSPSSSTYKSIFLTSAPSPVSPSYPSPSTSSRSPTATVLAAILESDSEAMARKSRKRDILPDLHSIKFLKDSLSAIFSSSSEPSASSPSFAQPGLSSSTVSPSHTRSSGMVGDRTSATSMSSYHSALVAPSLPAPTAQQVVVPPPPTAAPVSAPATSSQKKKSSQPSHAASALSSLHARVLKRKSDRKLIENLFVDPNDDIYSNSYPSSASNTFISTSLQSSTPQQRDSNTQGASIANNNISSASQNASRSMDGDGSPPQSPPQVVLDASPVDETAEYSDEEEAWNPGYRHWKAQRKRWTTRTVPSTTKESEVDAPPHPVKLISEDSYARVYHILVNEGRRLKQPVNLADATKILVAGWQSTGQWPPPSSGPDPLIGRRRR
ncbi:uncharacterized protein V1516DRAFT_436992 [Lipomyces oligophaga]|uniref:uncharacterized protein n=1 Tax=Lipomyces oligophaga TaxID=45792 RepID=UPI0034CEA030